MKIYLLWQLGMDWQTCPHILLHIFLEKEKILNIRYVPTILDLLICRQLLTGKDSLG